jgi:predicted porin
LAIVVVLFLGAVTPALAQEADDPVNDQASANEQGADESTATGQATGETIKGEPPADKPALDELVADLRRLLETIAPRIEQLEGRDETLSEEEINELRKSTEQLLAARRAAREAADPEAVQPAEIERAAELEARMNALAREAQEFSAEPEEPRTAPLMNVLRAFQLYGSLRGRLRFREDEPTEFDENTSRVGIRTQLPIGSKFAFFGRAEIGLRLSDVIDFAGDPGSSELAEGGDVDLRLAFAGFETPIGRLSFGKQWGAYYDVAIFTDQMPYLCCEGHVVYNAGTDGGVSGTGRADWAFQYRQSTGPVKFTLQGQFRKTSPVATTFADTYGASVIYRWNEVVDFGVSHNRVLDGIAAPEQGQPKEGDRATILGVRYQENRLYLGANYSRFQNHETDDLDRFFGGESVILFASYFVIPDRLVIAAELDDVKPKSSHPGQYRVRFATVGASYSLRKYWEFFLLYRFENGRLSDGSRAGKDTLMLSVHFNF